MGQEKTTPAAAQIVCSSTRHRLLAATSFPKDKRSEPGVCTTSVGPDLLGDSYEMTVTNSPDKVSAALSGKKGGGKWAPLWSWEVLLPDNGNARISNVSTASIGSIEAAKEIARAALLQMSARSRWRPLPATDQEPGGEPERGSEGLTRVVGKTGSLHL